MTSQHFPPNSHVYAPPYGLPPMPEVQYFATPFAPQDASKPGGNLQYNMQMPTNNNTWSQPRRPETKPPMERSRRAANPTPTPPGFTSVNGPRQTPIGVVKPSQSGRTHALQLGHGDHRAQALLAAAAQDLSQLKTSSGKNFIQIMEHSKTISLNTVAIMQKLYAIDEKVTNNGKNQDVIGGNLMVTQHEFQAAQMDTQAILQAVQAAREEDQAAREKNQEDIRALEEEVRIMSEGQRRYLDELKGPLEEMMRFLQRVPTPQNQTDYAEDTSVSKEVSEIVVRAPEKAETKRPRRSGGKFAPRNARTGLRASSRILRSGARPRA